MTVSALQSHYFPKHRLSEIEQKKNATIHMYFTNLRRFKNHSLLHNSIEQTSDSRFS